MKAIVLKKSGPPRVLKISDVPEPVPAAVEVGVRLHYTGVNYAEILSRKGLYDWAPKRPYILGMEGAGEIETVGDGVDKSRIGQKVIVGTQLGCYAEKIAVPQELAVPALEQYSMEENAAFIVNYMTAWVALWELARLQKHEKVLITSAAGGVGSAAVQLTAKLGCEVYGLAGSQEKIDLVKSLGAAEALNYRDNDCFQQLREISGKMDVILETVGGRIYKESRKLLNPFGRMAVVGFSCLNLKKWNPVSWWQTLRDLPLVSLHSLAIASNGIMATHLGFLLKDTEKTIAIFERLKQFVTDNQIRPIIGKTFPFEQASAAHAFIESRKSVGKVLLRHNS
ncbi:MAG: zinc-binding alcohol dehydrogenase family protein [bacterium]